MNRRLLYACILIVGVIILGCGVGGLVEGRILSESHSEQLTLPYVYTPMIFVGIVISVLGAGLFVKEDASC